MAKEELSSRVPPGTKKWLKLLKLNPSTEFRQFVISKIYEKRDGRYRVKKELLEIRKEELLENKERFNKEIDEELRQIEEAEKQEIQKDTKVYEKSSYLDPNYKNPLYVDRKELNRELLDSIPDTIISKVFPLIENISNDELLNEIIPYYDHGDNRLRESILIRNMDIVHSVIITKAKGLGLGSLRGPGE